MYFDLAPMEGITGAAFRRLHHQYFPGVDRYYAPFLSPTREHLFTPRELRDILPEHNCDAHVVPQILTKVPEDFLWMAGELHAMGYEEVNLNAGCPSGTVTAKGKGAGLLADPQELDRFLAAIFAKAPCAISVKTRLGLEDPEEFGPILEIYDRYPIAELIIHPRVRQDFYRHPVRTEVFEKALAASRNPVSYNGGLLTAADCAACAEKYPQLCAIMVGQGLLADPFLAGRVKRGTAGDRETLRAFHDRLLESYIRQFGDQNNAVRRMKELWSYLLRSFADSEKYGKRLMKARRPEEYADAVSAIFRDLSLRTGGLGAPYKP